MGLFLQRIGRIKIMSSLFLQVIGRIKKNVKTIFVKIHKKKEKNFLKLGFLPLQKRVGYGEISNRLWL